MAILKREYNVPLRRKVKTAPIWRRSKKAISVLKDFMKQHMKAENVIICAELNELIWARGGKCPPGKISVIALRTEVNGVDSTIVNLATIGVDTQMAKYGTVVTEEAEAPVAAVKEVKEVKAEKKTEESEKKAETKKETKEE
jgi:large subunit ribosomal protein L31e